MVDQKLDLVYQALEWTASCVAGSGESSGFEAAIEASCSVDQAGGEEGKGAGFGGGGGGNKLMAGITEGCGLVDEGGQDGIAGAGAGGEGSEEL